MTLHVRTKICNSCKISKPITEFRESKSYKEGRRSHCKECDKVRVRRYQQTPKGRAHQLVNRAKLRAAKSGLPHTITAKWVLERLLRGKCEVTGIPFELNFIGNDKEVHPWTPSLDQIDPGKGYTPDNVQVVTYMYNMAKAQFGPDELLRLAKAILTPE